MQPFFDPLDTKYKSITGAVQQNTILDFFVSAEGYNEAYFILEPDGGFEKAYPMQKTSGGFFVSVKTEIIGLYGYFFIIDGARYGSSRELFLIRDSLKTFQLTVYSNDYKTPDFLKGGIIYQIFPDRFCKVGEKPIDKGKKKRPDWGGKPTFRDEDGEVRNNEFFGGNFEGGRSKIPYLKSLGVTTVYFNPISEAYSSHRYDTGDYLTPDKQLGDENELGLMLSEMKEAGISAIFDGVYNHTGADSRYFNKYGNYDCCGAYNAPSSEYLSWYRFKNYPDVYDSWWGFENLPATNPYSSFRKFIVKEVIPKYMKIGFKGVRLDVVDEIPDDFVEDIRKAVKTCDCDGVVVGEVWEDATNKIAYGVRRKYFFGAELDSVMNYPLKNAIIDYLLHSDPKPLKRVIREQINNYPAPALHSLMNVLSTHDTSRIITVLGRSKVVTDKDLMADEVLDEEEYQKGKNLAKIAYTLVYFLYGVPSLYYGDEAGLTGDLDPYNRLCFPWNNEDEDMLSFIRKIGVIRRNFDVLKNGKTNVLHSDGKTFVFERTDGRRKIVVAASRENASVKLKFNVLLKSLLSDDDYSKEKILKSDTVDVFVN